MRDAKKDQETYFRMLSTRMRLNMDVHPWRWDEGTPAEELCVDLIQRYPTSYRNRAQVMNHLFLCLGNGFYWTKQGTMTWKKTGEIETSRDYACSTFAHESGSMWLWYPGGPRHSAIFHIPENVTDDWLYLALSFIHDFLAINPKVFAMGAKADLLTHYGMTNPYAKEEAVRRVETLKRLQAELTAYVKEQGWNFLLPRRETKKQKEAQAKLADQIVSEILAEEAAAK